MPTTYGAESVQLKPCKLPKAALLSIGRLVRACAEIEDIINLYICGLAQINVSQGIVFLGKTPVKRRVEMGEYLADMRGAVAAALHKQIFNSVFWEVQTCRNAVAHGTLMGVSKDRRYAFLTNLTKPTETSSAIQEVISYAVSDIAAFADIAEEAIPLLETRLKLQPLREERHTRPLSPHRKAQPQRKKGAKFSRPPRSSRA
jgi:hypothetical protein